MCGRFENNADISALLKKLALKAEENLFPELLFQKTNIPPTLPVQTIINNGGEPQVILTNWGIKFSPDSPLIFNSRIETIKEKQFWKGLLEKNRSLVPMSAFYEWKKIGTRKQPFRVSLKNHELFFVPAVSVKLKGAEGLFTSLVTTVPNDFIKQIHHRMPVIFTHEQVKNFFEKPVEELIMECLPCSEEMMMIPADI